MRDDDAFCDKIFDSTGVGETVEAMKKEILSNCRLGAKSGREELHEQPCCGRSRCCETYRNKTRQVRCEQRRGLPMRERTQSASASHQTWRQRGVRARVRIGR